MRVVARRGHFVGEARCVEQRSRMGAPGAPAMLVRTFRVVAYDDDGNRMPPLQVEMAGPNFTGVISEGDWVEVPGASGGGGTIVPAKVYDHTTRTLVRPALSFSDRVSLFHSWVGQVFTTLIFFAFLLGCALLAYLLTGV